MTKKTFSAEQWFQAPVKGAGPVVATELYPADKCPIRARFPRFINKAKSAPIPDATDRFSPVGCFTPGWKGDSLTSRSVVKFQRLMSQVQLDVKAELLKTRDFPRTIKLGLHEEFLSFAESRGLVDEKLGDLASFWQLLTKEKLEECPHLNEFVDIYCGRVATIIFLKLRFISVLVQSASQTMTDKALLYPTAYLSQIFRKGGNFELNSRALESNLYSWYRANESMKGAMQELLDVSGQLGIAEIIKNVSGRTKGDQDQQRVYSHALSHVGVGLFLNSLQINLPMWIEAIEGRFVPEGNLEQQKIISCKYFGDYLESMALSHWLAQENNRDFRWDEMLCPDFKGREFIAGAFTKICNELQFLTFLVTKAESQGDKPIDYICKITGGHYRNRKGVGRKDSAMLLADNPFYTSTYDRVVLNLCHFPKNNPQHFLMSQILDQVKYLKANGYLFVLSTKKLFVPSLRERLVPVMAELKLEAIFDLEEVKGKGELGTYIYVFRKTQVTGTQRQLCSYFRISAELDSFAQFSAVTEHLRSFYLANLSDIPAMGHLEFQDSFRLEFFQEAIVDGMLIHSASEDSRNITHPAYFKSLLESCVPLETLFEIRPLSYDEHMAQREGGFGLGLKKDMSYFLVVDFRRSEVALELHPIDTYRSIHAEYGQSLCGYYQLHPKLPGLNPNILRNYFATAVGKQVTQLTFSGGPVLSKGALKKLLVPKLLTQTEILPEHLKTGFAVLEMTEEELLEASPQALVKAFIHIDQISRDLFPKYACEILSRLSGFERKLQTLIWRMDDDRYGQKVSFSNPVIQAKLVQRTTHALYPDNDDVFIEFVSGSNAQDLHLALSDVRHTVSQEAELKLHALELSSAGRVIVRMHADEGLILFVHYLLSHAINVPISRLLRAVQVPSSKDLKEIIESSSSFKETYQDLLGRVQKSMTDAFRVHLGPKRLP